MNSYNIKEKQNVKDDNWDIYSSNLPLVLSDEQWCYDLFHMSEFGKPADGIREPTFNVYYRQNICQIHTSPTRI